jgi:hypothetical protein
MENIFLQTEQSVLFVFCCPFWVGREVLLGDEVWTAPPSWPTALLNALVTAYKPHHHKGRTKVRPFVFSFTTRGLAEKRLLETTKKRRKTESSASLFLPRIRHQCLAG